MNLFGKSAAQEQQEKRDYTDEEVLNLRQALGEAESKCKRMVIARTPEGMMKMAEEAANQIEEFFAVGGMSRAHRFKNIAQTIRRQIAIAVQGEAIWSD